MIRNRKMCESCGKPMLYVNHSKKYCKDCRILVVQECSKYEEKNKKCINCNNKIIMSHGNRKYCKECLKLVKILNWAKRRARDNGIDFNITEKDIIIPEYCPILGIKLDKKLGRNHIPSLDRIDISKGYIKGNVCIISFKANMLKNNSTIEQLTAILSYMKKHRVR